MTKLTSRTEKYIKYFYGLPPLAQTLEGGDGLHPTDMLRNRRFLALKNLRFLLNLWVFALRFYKVVALFWDFFTSPFVTQIARALPFIHELKSMAFWLFCVNFWSLQAVGYV